MLKPEFRRSASVPDSFRPLAGQAAALIGQALTLALLSRARLLGELSPFAPACLSAGLVNGWSAWAMLVGCAAGSLSSGTEAPDLLPLICCAIGLALHGLLRLLRRQLPQSSFLHGSGDFLSAAVSGLSMLIPGLCVSGGIPYNLMTASLSAVVSALIAPALSGGMGVRLYRRRLMPEEQLSLSLLLMIALIGLRAAPYAGRFLSLAAACLLTLTGSGVGSGMGAMFGLAAGAALTLSGSDPFVGSTLGLCGLLAGCVRKLPRPAAALTLLMGNLLTITWGLGYTVGALDVPPALTAGLIYCLIPAAPLQRLRGWMQPTLPRVDPEALSVRLRQRAGKRLGEISEIFGELADGYGEQVALPGEQSLISEMRHALCDGCESYADCWLGEQPQAGRLMCRMAAQALSGQDVTPTRDLPPDLIRHCRRSGQIDRRVLPVLTNHAEVRRNLLRRGEAKGLMARQFREAQRILDSLATQLGSAVCLNREYADLAYAALDRAGIRAQEVTAMIDERIEIVCALKDGVWNARSAQHVAALLSDEMGVPFSPVLKSGRAPGECELRLRQAPALTALTGTACAASEEGLPCGDSHLTQLLPDGRLIAAISDGMGHGEAAEAESRRCISLLRKFVSAGIDRDAALTAVNSLLLMRSGEDMYATADLCVIDLYSGVASFSKLGACRSLILGENGMRQIPGGRLPLGVLDQVEPACVRAEVHPGDLLVMFSDGVADEMKDGQPDELAVQLRKLRRMKPEAAAQAILSWAQSRDEGRERDDMTVVAVRILARKIRPL